jgi:hypothetical protein
MSQLGTSYNNRVVIGIRDKENGESGLSVCKGCVFLPLGTTRNHNDTTIYHKDTTRNLSFLPQGYSSDTKRNNEVSQRYPMARDTLRKESLEFRLPCLYNIPQGILGIL